MAEPKKTSPEKPGTQVLPAPAEPFTKKAPLYHVILHDDDMHTYNYVIAMLIQLFGKQPERAFEHAVEVDKTGVTIVDTTTLERAELKRDQIKAYGRDPLIPKSTSGMYASIEPAD
jgi:ATP-dependent Clp protease adaptor protein ClpS